MAINKREGHNLQGFTLLELLIVVFVIALGSAGVMLAMRDTGQTQLEREALRLAALLDAARGQSRTAGVVVTWEQVQGEQGTQQMRWRGLRAKEPLPTQWLDLNTHAVVTAPTSMPIVLGPDAVIAPVRVRLQLGADVREVVSDGVGAFQVKQGDAP